VLDPHFAIRRRPRGLLAPAHSLHYRAPVMKSTRKPTTAPEAAVAPQKRFAAVGKAPDNLNRPFIFKEFNHERKDRRR